MPLRLAELVAGLCVVSDLGRGLTDGQGLRCAVLSQDLAAGLGWDEDQRRTLYWLSLLRFVGCTTTAAEMSVLGDELAVSAAFASADTADLREVIARARTVTGPRPDRLVAFLARAPRTVALHETTSCEVAQSVALQLGLPEDVTVALGQVFERYDGKGNPGRVGPELHPAAGFWQAVHFADLAESEGLDPAPLLRRRAGTALDPDAAHAVADALARLPGPVPDTVAAVLEREPGTVRTVPEEDVEDVLRAFALLADGKAACFRGHSEAVAVLAATAATAAGLPGPIATQVRRAGLVHDIGKVAISARVWSSDRPLTDAQREQVELHPYYTRRILARVPALADLADLAASHHERADGTGYPHNTRLASLPAAVLAAADTWVTAGEARPHRAARADDERERILRALAEDGALPAAAVDAVLRAAAGDHSSPAGAPSSIPGELTAREHDVLELVAEGLTNAAAGRRLGISAKTVNAHLEHIYGKLGVSTRVAAVVHAHRRGWLA